jgi:aerobic-type carbon monoxide dehydrogenase small subunit (CoxS/CutS family)
MSRKKPEGVSRRGFLKGVGGAVGAGAVGAPVVSAAPTGPTALGPGKVAITITVNGVERELDIEPRVTLLNALRNSLDLTGTKKICDRGQCGGCNVLVDGLLVNSCMMLALDAAGAKVQTVEGLATGDKLHPIQEAFCEVDALQCGFCTPGMVMACKALLDRHKRPSRAEIREGLAGNLCRCGTYTRIFDAVERAAKKG